MTDFTDPAQDDSIHARDVRPGMVVWNPYGGDRGRAVVASEPRERPDGAIEFDSADGRTGVYRPHFRLHFDRTATQRLAAERDAERQSTAGRPPERRTGSRIEDRTPASCAGTDWTGPELEALANEAASEHEPEPGG